MSKKPYTIDVARFGTARISSVLTWRYGVALFAVFSASLCVSYAQTLEAGAPTALETLFGWIPFILRGFSLNLYMSFLAMALATILGIFLGLMQISVFGPVRVVARLVTHLFRNSPWLVILFIAMYMMPENLRLPAGIAVPFPGWAKATVAFALPVMGNISEIVRGAVRSIPTGQWESAESLGFTRPQTLWNVILPQSFKRAIPPWMNWYALLTLSTPMASIFSVRESVANAQAAMEASGGKPEFLFPFYLFLLCLFFVYIYPIALLTRKLEKKYAI
ncbi:amino acid ABC transporter permease [Limoniibacter endophyticus]|uniref:Amino acid ABC transporter n=1 Tax=Limoniibacter endophyticus TaxID=1565040 RepID=A0A8J3DNI9_9HYPH|nr:ABC transporter permease subunit [Limoniibacter endophyticus]GHC68038.1 amino acid ABC transporter [Limoniibacter endophyticus]